MDTLLYCLVILLDFSLKMHQILFIYLKLGHIFCSVIKQSTASHLSNQGKYIC